MGENTPSEPPPTRDEVEDLVADLFGDFSDGEEPSPAPGTGRSTAQAPAPSSQSETPLNPSESPQSARPTPEGPASQTPVDGPRKKRRKIDASKYFDTEAVEAGGSEDEDEVDLSDIIDDSAPMDRDSHDRQKVELDRLQKEMDDRHFSGSTIRESGFLQDLEARARLAADENDEGINLEDIGKIVPDTPSVIQEGSQQLTVTVPDSTRDPRLWCIKTFAPERELIMSLVNKAAEFATLGKECPIYSAFYNPALRGYIYVEAFKDNDIRAFSKGIRGISPWAIRLVPVAQMPQVFSAAVNDSERKDGIKEGDWVRMKRGIYTNDLAQIEEVMDDEYVVKLKPRLDFSANIGKMNSKYKADKADRAAKKRPVAQWFNRADVEAAGMVINQDRRFGKHGYLSYYLVDGEIYRDGFLYQKKKAHYFISGDTVRPSEHELHDWNNAPVPSLMTTPERDLKKVKPAKEEKEEEDRKSMPPPVSVPSKRAERLNLEVDDIVIVTHGDLQNMRGTVIKAFPGGPTVLVRPLPTEGIKEGLLTISVDRLSKFFQVGDHVKAEAGAHKGASGYVVQVQLRNDGGPKWAYGATVTIVSLIGSHHAEQNTVLVNHIRLSVERAAPAMSYGEFEVGRVAKFSGGVCLIKRIEANCRAIVLDTNGQTQMALFDEMEPLESAKDGKGGGRTSGISWTVDKKNNRILVNDIVLASKNRGLPIKCEVIWIFGSICFLKAVEGLSGENAYLVAPGTSTEFVVRNAKRAERIQEAKKKAQERADAMETEMSGLTAFNTDIRKASSTSFVKGWVKKLMGLPADPKSGGLTTLEHKGVAFKITGGAYKGLRAEVRDVLGDKVLLSLLAKPKLILVDMQNLARDDYTKTGVKTWLDSRDDATNRRNNGGDEYNPQTGAPQPVTPEAPSAPNAVPPSPLSEPPGDVDDRALAVIRETEKDDRGDAEDREEWDPSFGMPKSMEV